MTMAKVKEVWEQDNLAQEQRSAGGGGGSRSGGGKGTGSPVASPTGGRPLQAEPSEWETIGNTRRGNGKFGAQPALFSRASTQPSLSRESNSFNALDKKGQRTTPKGGKDFEWRKSPKASNELKSPSTKQNTQAKI